jgi:hypothetical protein
MTASGRRCEPLVVQRPLLLYRCGGRGLDLPHIPAHVTSATHDRKVLLHGETCPEMMVFHQGGDDRHNSVSELSKLPLEGPEPEIWGKANDVSMSPREVLLRRTGRVQIPGCLGKH